jgi:hypothetical protein
MKLHLNLATSPQANNRPFVATAVLMGTIGVLALLGLSHAAYASWRANRELREDTARWEAVIRADQQQQRALEAAFRDRSAQQVLDRSTFLNSLIDQRAFPWTKIFMDLEQTLPSSVRVVSITPAITNGRVELSLQVGAMTDEGKVEFLQAIEKSKVFSGMVVKDDRRSEQASSPDKILLDLTVWYSTT